MSCHHTHTHTHTHTHKTTDNRTLASTLSGQADLRFSGKLEKLVKEGRVKEEYFIVDLPANNVT